MAQEWITRAIETLANSEQFQSWTGVETAAAAKAFVHDSEVDAGDIERPCAMVGTEGFEAERSSYGPVDRYDKSGAVALWLEADRNSENTLRQDIIAFNTIVDNIIEDILDLSGTEACLSIQRATLAEPAAVWREADGEIIVIKYLLNWR